MWQRWNGTSHVFEKSDDNGSSWAPLPLSAATITEGILASARLPANVAFKDAANVFTAHQTLSGAGLIFAGSIGLAGPSMFLNANSLMIRGGLTGFGIQNQAGSAQLMYLSDAGLLNINTSAAHTIGAGGAGSTISSIVMQGGSGAAGGGLVQFMRGAVTVGWIGAEVALIGGVDDTLALYSNQPSGIALDCAHASGPIKFKMIGVEQARFQPDGNFLSGVTGAFINNARMSMKFNPSSFAGIIIGVTADISSGYFLMFANASNGVQGSISIVNSTTIAFNTTSDARLKKDLGIVRETDVLKGTIVHDFEWIPNGVQARGVFAQEAIKVLPSAITIGDKNPGDDNIITRPWMTDYSKYIPDLIVGWQMHEARLAALEGASSGK